MRTKTIELWFQGRFWKELAARVDIGDIIIIPYRRPGCLPIVITFIKTSNGPPIRYSTWAYELMDTDNPNDYIAGGRESKF